VLFFVLRETRRVFLAIVDVVLPPSFLGDWLGFPSGGGVFGDAVWVEEGKGGDWGGEEEEEQGGKDFEAHCELGK